MLSFDSWYEALYGPQQISFTPQWVTNPTSQTGIRTSNTPQPVPSTKNNFDTTNYGGGDGGSMPGSDHLSLYDPEYWGTDWTPDLDLMTNLQDYGKYFAAGPLMGGLMAVKDLSDFTKVPAWQEAVKQYLAEYSPQTTLDQFIDQIKTLYEQHPNLSKQDLARGALMGLNPNFSEAYADWSAAGGTPAGFAQEATGLQAMANAFPDIGLNTTPSVEPTFGTPNNLSEAFMQSYGISGPPSAGGWYDAVHGRNMAPGQALAEAAARTQKSQHQRTLSREWMEETLAKKTTKTFKEWKEEKESKDSSKGGFGNTSDPAGDPGNLGYGGRAPGGQPY